MQKTIITTVGTSLITNYFEKIRIEKQPNPDLQDDYEKVKELSFFEHNRDEKKIVKTLERAVNIKTKLNSFSNCAEISSIIAIEKELKVTDKKLLTIHLLCTDTILSPLCAEVIAKYLIKEGYNVNFEQVADNETIISKIKEQGFVSKYIIKDLRVDSKGNYERGFMNLIENLDELKLTKNDILNITGGYKAIIPILTLYGQLKEIPLKYIYNENELDKKNELVTVGNLPFGLDWAAVEALKPFLNKYFLSTKEVNEFVVFWSSGQIILNIGGSFIGKNEEAKAFLENYAQNNNFLKLILCLINYQLIYLDNTTKKIDLSALGIIVSDKKGTVPLGTIKGHIIEHLLFKYFCLFSKNNLITKNYTSNLSIPNITKGEKHKDIEIGDIDVFLTYSKDSIIHNVWGEAKAKSIAEGYATDNEKYYKQLKARILYLNKPFLETLLIVYRFAVDGVTNEPFLTDKLRKSLLSLQNLNSDDDLKGKSIFKCIGVTIPLIFRENRIVTEPFYKGDFSTWKWEELFIKETSENPATSEILS